MKKYSFLIILCLIAIVGMGLRMYNIKSPIADWHSWRQVDTAAVARNFLKFGIDPLHPHYDDLSNIQSGKDNPEGLRMVEFPIYQLLAVGIYRILPNISIEIALRLISILASGVSIVCIGLITRKIYSERVGLYAALSFSILPYNIYYGRTTLPESLMVSFIVVSLSLATISLEQKKLQKILFLILSSISAGVALLVKPFAIFFLLPLPYLFVLNLGFSSVFFVVSVICSLLAVAPLLLWRKWITQFPEGIPVYTWLFNEGNIRFKGAWFHWLFAERIGKLILGYWGTIILGLGFIRKNRNTLFLFPWILLLGGLSYFIIVARGNVQHDYYQIPIIFILSIFLGNGIEFLFHPSKEINKIVSSILGGVVILFTLAFSWFEIRGYFWINHPELVEAGKKADEILPKNAKVIAPYNGDTTFLYQINRQGWPIGFEIEKKIAQGAQYYVTVSPSDSDGETKDLASRYTVLVRNDQYAIIDLTKPLVK